MRKLTFLLLFIICTTHILNAQTFSKAPKAKSPVKKITEWTTFSANEDDPEETIKDGIYTFRRDGQLENWVSNNSYDEVFYYSYDSSNRLAKVSVKGKDTTRLMTYQYFPDRQMAEIQEREIDVRTIQYFNKKKQVIEEKTFAKGKITGGKWATMDRTVFNYNQQDSLFGEMIYSYEGSAQPVNKKNLHHYDPATHKKTKSIFFGSDGKPWKEINYTYDKTGLLVKCTKKEMGTSFEEETQYLYKNGQKWQVITQAKDYRSEYIYKNGQLIRTKEYDKNGEMLWFTDYQYEYY